MSEAIELKTWVELYEVRRILNAELGTGTTRRMLNHDAPSLTGTVRMLFADPTTSPISRPLHQHSDRERAVASALIRLDAVLAVLECAPTVVGQQKRKAVR